MLVSGKEIILSPIGIFSTSVETEQIRATIEFIKSSFHAVIIEKKISQKQYDEYIHGMDYIPVYHLNLFESWVNKSKNSFGKSNVEDYIFSLFIMDGWYDGGILRMNKFNYQDIKFSPNLVDVGVMISLRIFSQISKPIYLKQKDESNVGCISKQKTNEEFLTEFNKNYEKIKWMLEKYSPNKIIVMDMALDEKKSDLVYQVLLDAWDEIPEDEINLKISPDGYNEYLNLLCDYKFDGIK